MNPAMMQRFLYLRCYVHEIVFPRRRDMHRGDNFGLRQLPDMKLVQVEDAPDLEDQFTNLTERNIRRNAL